MCFRKQQLSKLTLVLAVMLPGILSAAPVNGVFTYHQPDGSKLSVRVKGDEFFAEEETLDGQRLVQDPVTKFWCYAKLSDDGTDLESTGIAAGDGSPRATKSGEFAPAYLRVRTPKEYRQRIDRANRERFNRDHRGRVRHQDPEGILPAAGTGTETVTVQPMVSSTTLGGKRGLTILIRFPDRAGDVTISRAQVDNYCNQTSSHYTEFGNNGSVSEYFLDVSNGKLNYTNTVADYYTTKNNRSYYTDETQARAPELVKDALNALESGGFDFRSVDADGNGAIDALNIFYAGPVVNSWAKGLWPHASGLSWTSGRTGVKATGYQISAIGSKLELGTFCHENGHLLCGFPDVYDYDGDSVGGSGAFDLMDAGCFGGNPCAPNGYMRYKAGWGSVEWLGTGVNATKMLTAESGGRLANQFVGFANSANTKEYFLLENFYKNDRNSGAPTGGMAVWHVDEQGDHNKQNYGHNTTHNNYEVALIQADNQRHFERNSNNGDARDLFYAGNAAAGYLNEFSDTSDSGAYDNNAHWWSGTKSGLKLTGFSGQGNTMSVIVQTPGGVVVPPTTDGVATFYKDCSYGGTAVGLPSGDYKMADLVARGIANDDISSLKVANGYKVQLFWDDNFTGSTITKTANSDCLVADGWNDQVTSLKIRPNGVSGLNGTWILQNRNSNLVMDVANGNPANGTQILQWNNTGAANQQFIFTDLGDGLYKVINVQTNKTVDVSGVSKDNFANVTIWDYVGGKNQQFIVKATDSGYYKLIAAHSSKLLEVGYASTALDAKVNQYDDNNQTCGQWKLLAPTQQAWSTTLQAEAFVNMAGVQTEACTEGGSNVGWIDAGDWMVWDVNLPSAGTYKVEYRVASPNATGVIQLEKAGGSPVYGKVTVPNTGGWQNWQTVSHSVSLPAGQQQLAIAVPTGGYNVNWIKLSK